MLAATLKAERSLHSDAQQRLTAVDDGFMRRSIRASMCRFVKYDVSVAAAVAAASAIS